MKFQDLTGQKFNKLTVIKYLGQVRTGQSNWSCLCDCGNPEPHNALGSHLKTGNIRSCGCLAKGEPRRVASTRHGMSFTSEWNSFHSCKKRCNLKFKDKWPDWGGRGIEFRFNSFEEFYQELGPKPEPKFDYTCDRIDNDGHYEKGNVRWATRQEQARNRRCDNCIILKKEIERLKNLLTTCTAV